MPKFFTSLLLIVLCVQGQGQPNAPIPVPFVVASLEAIPPTAQACSELVFSGLQSRDSRGQPLQFFWGFGPGTPSWFRIPLLAGVLEEATGQSSPLITISPAILSRAGAELGDLREGEVRLEVRLTVRNDLGNSTEAVTSSHIVGLTSQAEPAISPVGSTNLKIKHSDDLHLEVTTGEAPFALQCANRDPGISAGRTNVTWQYRSTGQLSWQPLEASLGNLAFDPNHVNLAPYSFQPGTFHLFRAVAAFDLRPTLAPRPSVVFRVSVEALPAVKVFIVGPRLASQCSFELDVEVWDPTMPQARKEDFLYSWRCSSVVQVGELDLCAQLPPFTTTNPSFGPKFRVDAGQLAAGIHRFSVIVRRVSGGPQSIARHPVHVAPAFFASLRMRFPSYAYTGIVDVADGAPAVSAIMQLTGDLGARCAAPQVHWQWFLVEDRLTPTLERALNTSSIAADGFLELQSGGGGMLLAGVQYFHVLLQAETKNIMDQATANVSRPSLDSVLRKGLAMAAMSPKFVGDQVPLGGAVSVLPAFHGMSLRTTFAVNTFSWTDEDLSGLEYEFLTFPFEALNGSNGLAADLNIDWEDPDSMRFWTTLGGRRFRLFSRSPQAFLQAPPGVHWLVVRARDVRGGISVAASSMPVVVEAEHNFSIADATAVLARVEVTNEVTQLLQAVRAISIIADPAVKIKTCSTDFFGTVTCDQIPSAEVVRPALRALNAAAPFVRDGDTLGKMGAALEGMIQVAFEPSIETVDVTSIFGDSLNPGNRSEDENLTEELVEPPEPVFVNVSRIQVLPEFLVSISRALTTAQQAMLAEQALGSARGLDGFAAHQVWSSLVALQSAIQGTMNVDRNLPQEMRALVDSLGALSLPSLPIGRELWLRTPPDLTVRADMMLAKVRSGSDAELPGLFVPREVSSGSRRLQSCDELEVQVADWYNLNPHFAAPRGFGVTDLLLPNSSIKGLILRHCGEPARVQGLSRPVEMDFSIDQPQGVHSGYIVEHRCAVFNEGLGAWSEVGVSSKDVVTNTSTQMTCQTTQSYGYFAAYYRVVREAPPPTTTPPPPPKEEEEWLSLPALVAIVMGTTICIGGAVGGIYAWRLSRTTVQVEPEEEEKEEEVEESESEVEVHELPDPDPALTKLRQAAEAGTLTAREILARHSGPTGIRQELVWAIDKGYENKRREAAKKKAKAFAQGDALQAFEEEFQRSDDSDDGAPPPRQVKAKAKIKPRRSSGSSSSQQKGQKIFVQQNSKKQS